MAVVGQGLVASPEARATSHLAWPTDRIASCCSLAASSMIADRLQHGMESCANDSSGKLHP